MLDTSRPTHRDFPDAVKKKLLSRFAPTQLPCYQRTESSLFTAEGRMSRVALAGAKSVLRNALELFLTFPFEFGTDWLCASSCFQGDRHGKLDCSSCGAGGNRQPRNVGMLGLFVALVLLVGFFRRSHRGSGLFFPQTC